DWAPDCGGDDVAPRPAAPARRPEPRRATHRPRDAPERRPECGRRTSAAPGARAAREREDPPVRRRGARAPRALTERFHRLGRGARAGGLARARPTERPEPPPTADRAAEQRRP